jgi:uncharacterized membrane protein/glycosyltransferase involved in cell wall biosynthesis
MAKKLPLISVVVCSLNGAVVIPDTLKAIKAQKWAGKLEIIVVDDGSTDDTYKIAKSFKGVKVIKNKKNLGCSSSRNIGIKAAKGEIIAFTDDDCRPRPTWIKELYAGYTGKDIVGVGGEIISNDKSNLTQRYLSSLQPHKPLEKNLLKSTNLIYRLTLYLKELTGLGHPIPNRKRTVYSLSGGNMSFRKNALEENLFDERFGYGAEETDLCFRFINKNSNSICFAPKAKVVHQYEGNLPHLLRRSREYGIGNARNSRKHMVRPTIYPFPVIILLSFLLGFISPWLLIIPFILVLVIYSRGVRLAIKKRNLEPLVYSYIDCAYEWYSNTGFIKGLWRYRNTFHETPERSKVITAKAIASKLITNFSEKGFNFSVSSNKTEQEKPQERNNKLLSEAGTIVLILGLVLAATLVKRSTIFHVPAAIVIVLLSGYMLLRGFSAERQRRFPGMLRLALMATLGLAWIMFFGLIADIVLPTFGFKHPLTSSWIPLIFVSTTGLLIPWSLRYKIAPKKTHNFKLNWDTLALSGLLILMLFCSFCGARLLNNGYSNILATSAFVIGLLSIVFAVLRQKHLPKNIFPVVLFVLSAASVWSYSLRSNYVFGWDIQQEFHVFQTTLASGKWALWTKHSAFDAMLSLTILPVIIAKVSGIAGLTFFKFLSPLLFSFVPVILYYIYHLFTKRWISFLASIVVIAQFYYMQQFSALVRQQIGFLFFASILFLIFQGYINKRSRDYLLLLSVLGLVVSHYSTTYLAIIFLGGTYITTKVIFVLLQRYKKNKTVSQDKYIHGWTVAALIISALIWYGPVTHSSGYLQILTQKNDYSKIIQNTENTIRRHFNNHPYTPASTEAYLQTTGQQFRESHTYFSYYKGATNSSINPVTQPSIKTRWPILKTLADAADTTLRYSWWIFGGVGILVLIFSACKKLNYRKLELGILCSIGIIAFLAIHLIPTLGQIYNASRLNEQVLMFIGLPAILTFVRMLRFLSARSIRFIITGLICLAFAIASGTITQFVGGTAPANLNNFGADYDSFYIQQSDLASAQWLGNKYTSNSTVFTDPHSNLRLAAANSINQGQFFDVTPETIAVSSFVYADYANVKDDITVANASINGQGVTYTFPTSFLQQNKNLIYSNGDSKVYK